MGCKNPERPKQKQKHKKGLWSPDEDLKLKNHILKYGHGCWSSLPINAGLQRNGKSCRLRWINYLRPGLKRGAFTLEEEDKILALHGVLGNKWSQIAHHIPGRTDNEIKNHWHSYLKKRMLSKLAQKVQGKSEQSFKPTPRNCSSESSTDTDQSMQKIDQQPETGQCSLPKIMFAEWLSLDQFNNGHNQRSSSIGADLDYTFDYESANSGDSSVHDQQLTSEVTCNEMQTKSNSISISDILQSPFGFEDQISEGDLVDYFPGDFNFSCDDLYI